jgi:hypothetical protein
MLSGLCSGDIFAIVASVYKDAFQQGLYTLLQEQRECNP